MLLIFRAPFHVYLREDNSRRGASCYLELGRQGWYSSFSSERMCGSMQALELNAQDTGAVVAHAS